MTEKNNIIPLSAPEQPKAPNAKWCHKFFIPMTFAEQRPNPMNPREMMVEPKAQGVFVKCLGDQCTLWDAFKKQCTDISKTQALDRIAAELARRNDLEDRRELSETMAGVGT